MGKGQQRSRALIDATLNDDTAGMRRLLAGGADANARDREHAETVLMLCRSEEAATLLLAAGADVHARDARGRTPFLATRLTLLLDWGADINAQDAEGTTALMDAVQSADLSRTRELIRLGADAGVADSAEATALSHAEALGLQAIVDLLRSVSGLP